MNTNSNTYTVIYSAVIVVIVAAVLAFAAQALKSKQEANAKAETISQMLTAAQFYTKEELGEMDNAKVLSEYSSNIASAFTVNAEGEQVNVLATEGNIDVYDGLKAQNKHIKNADNAFELPVFVFNKDGKKVTVVPIYGAGLWGPVWGYMAFDEDLKTLVGAYFDHDSETPGLGGKIKDDPSFRAEFIGKVADFSAAKVIDIVKGGTTAANGVDAITGATMTSNGLCAAINSWLACYKPYFTKAASKECCEGDCAESAEEEKVEEEQ